nr:hypothetical protein [Tanacetum cinerariifolium]
MDQDSAYMVAASRVPMLKLGVITKMLITTTEEKAQRRLEAVALATAEQRLAKKNELKARGTLLMALPDKYQLKFNTHKDVKPLMGAIEKRFGGNKKTKKVHKTLLKKQYENFSGSSSESLDQIHDRLQKLISQLEILGESLSPEDINLKFLRSLPTEWRTHTLIWRKQTDLEDQSLDGLFNNLKIYEAESLLDNDDLKHINADDLEEMDLKWQMAMLTMRARRFLQRIGRNLGANGSTSIGFDMSKVKCYNCHRRCHFARECMSPRDTRSKYTQRRNVPVETSTSNAMVSQCDGVEDIQLLKLDVMLRDNALVELRKKFEKVEKERDELKLTLENFQTSLKNLSKLLASQIIDKTRLGYDNPMFNRIVFDCDELNSSESDVSVPTSPVHDSEIVPTVLNVEPSPTKHNKVLSQSHRPSDPIVEDWVSDSEDEFEAVKPVEDPTPAANLKKDIPKFGEINGGYVAFGRNPKGGKITSKGKIRTNKLDFDDVYFVKELKFNLFSVSQMRDKKNNVLFIDTECIVLSFDFKLPDENYVLLRVPRENNMYNVDLKNIVPLGDLTCLFAKATLDEYNLWHRRLGHINLKTMNKLVKGTGVKETASVQQYMLLPLWSNGSKDPQNTDVDAAFDVKEPKSEVHVSPSSSDKIKKHDKNTKREAKGKSHVELSTEVRNLSEEFEDFSSNCTNEVNAASAPVTAIEPNLTNSTNSFNAAGISNNAVSSTFEINGKSSFVDPSQYPDDPNMPALEDITYSDDEEDVGVEADFSNLETSITGHTQEEGIDYEEVFTPVVRIKATRTIKEEVYVCQPLGFEYLDYPNKVYKVVKALYGLHQAPRAWYETLANYLLENGFQRRKIDQTLFIKKQKGDILLVQKKVDGIFISQDKYVAKILRKFGLTDGKSASTPIDTKKPLLKDPDGEDVDVHTYMSMIASLMYLTSSRPDIMFAVCACARFQVTPKVSHLYAVKRIFSNEALAIPGKMTSEIFAELARMGYEKPSTKLTFYKAFFLAQWKFLIHTILQFGDISSPNTKYTSPALIQKVFANMRRIGNGFSGVDTSLFDAGSKDRPPMLAPGNYVQWKSRIKRYIDTKPNHEHIHYSLKNPPYELGCHTVCDMRQSSALDSA